MAVTKIEFNIGFPILTDVEEHALGLVAYQYDGTMIDGLPVYWIDSDTITNYIASLDDRDAKQIAILKRLDSKLKAYFGENFDSINFFFELEDEDVD